MAAGKNFFRKVGFGIGPKQTMPDDPLAWAKGQLDVVPDLSWPGKIPTSSELTDHAADDTYTEREVLRKRFKTDRQGFNEARLQLAYRTGFFFFENLELCIRHDAALNSGAPTFERLWFFWCNHFAITDRDNMPIWVTGPYHRDIIRQKMCGSFEELLTAATTSWAMIRNLDNSQSTGPNSEWGRGKRERGEVVSVNENHARELMELHSISPAAGYSQSDVVALSYIMAGWEYRHTKKRQEFNEVWFNQKKHEPGTHEVLGKTYKQRGLSPKNKLLDVIKDLAQHPSCREFITFKLCRHFITDEPTEEMTRPIIKIWEETDGHLPSIHKVLMEVVWEHGGKHQKFQNPEVWLLQMVNLAGAPWPPGPKIMDYDFKAHPNQYQKWPTNLLRELGHNPYRPTQPDGWPDVFEDWVSPELMVRRLATSYDLSQRFKARLKWKPDHILQSNFDDLAGLETYLGEAVNDPRDRRKTNQTIWHLFPSKWMTFA
jgi:uncharacterized protein (DUF1800 family)